MRLDGALMFVYEAAALNKPLVASCDSLLSRLEWIIGNTFCPLFTLVDASETTLKCERHSPKSAQTDDDP
jgi:hypothetical protein